MHPSETTRPRRTRYLWGTAAALVAVAVVGVALVAVDEDPAPQTDAPAAQAGPSTDEVEVATAFWEALAAGDRDAALALVSPGLLDSSGVSPYGRAETLAGQFDWYEAVGWEWRFEQCAPEDRAAVCTVTASNAWSDALGVEPVGGAFAVRFADDGIVSVSAPASFTAPWESMVFDEFRDWVTENHPDDAAMMWSRPLDSEILALFEINTERFVEAQQNQ